MSTSLFAAIKMMDMASSSSDSESDFGSSDNEDQYNRESVYGGHAQNILSSLDKSIEKIDDFLAFGRVFTHGDVVCSVANPSGQLGRVVDVDMAVDLETSSGELIKDRNSKNLLRLLSFSSGDYVVYGPWLGRVSRVFNLVTILFNDGAKCEIMTRDPDVVVPVTSYVNDYAPYLHYPGQRVRINVSALSKSARWLCGSWKVSQDEGTVCHVEVGLVDVNWIASAMISQGISVPVPSHLQDPKKLTLLSGFPYASWQVGDWCTLPVSYFSELPMASKESPPLCFATQHLDKSRKELGSKGQICKDIYVIAKTKTKVDVVWQNGLLQTGIDSHTLSPVAHVSDHDFWPEQFVLEKVVSEDAVVTSRERLGIVKNVNAQEQTVKVKWILPEHEKVAGFTGNSSEEIVSAYELIDHPDFSYSMGEIVFRLLPHLEHFEENLYHEGRDEYAIDYLSYIGNVIACKDEGIIVKWANGLISKVHPSEIFGLDRLDNPSSTSMVGEVRNLESVTNEIASQENLIWDEKEKVVNDSSEDFKSMWNTSSLTVPKAAITFLRNVASSLFGSFGSTSQSGSTKPPDLHCLKNLDLQIPTLDPTINMCCVQPEGNCKIRILKAKDLESDADDPLPEVVKHKKGVKGADDPPTEVVKHKAGVKGADDSLPGVLTQKGGAKQDEQNTLSPGNKKRDQFKRFDIVEDCSDHHFVSSVGNGLVLPLVSRDWVKKVQQEWSILKNNLHDGIYVRVYEERIDLLRATIIGADGTPYHNGLFFFDILFPPEYPREPPVIVYMSLIV
ncbi:putative ubiquitin-conjugating enzyme E2 24 [Iris pallida]|uniref:Ubiquitin-conjugating enzyme E2 24 n=1 Tax=Iris pallida TaxID=29817 RepID=A0AAX6DT01_IRIPA|nr:putative ubiquitin-conjugating enzyme E2 24 [Iris pallida]